MFRRAAAPTMTVNPTAVQPGQTFTVSGTGCFFSEEQPGDTGPEVEVMVGFTPPLVQSTNAGKESGTWSVTFTVPENTPPGSYTVREAGSCGA